MNTLIIKRYLAEKKRQLAPQPAIKMFPIGLASGASIGVIALLVIGGWPGMLICLLLLATTWPLVKGAEPLLPEIPKPSKPEESQTNDPDNAAIDVAVSFSLQLEAGTKKTVRIVQDIPNLLEMIELPEGEFLMGSPDDDDQAYNFEKPQHEVALSEFAMSRNLITRKLYREIMDEYPNQWQQDKDDNLLPANRINWYEAVRFCNALSENLGKTQCYRIDGNSISWDQTADGYRLPTEAEWEYSIRAGTTTRWFCGDDPDQLTDYAWFDKNSNEQLQPVGRKQANPWGFYDMAGNVWEWCWDWYQDRHFVDKMTNPTGPDNGVERVLRGDSFRVEAWRLRSAARCVRRPANRRDYLGFRIVRGPRPI